MAKRDINLYSDLYILQKLTSNKHTSHRRFNIKTSIELIQIMQYLKSHFLTENGNWSLKKYNAFLKKKNIDEKIFVNRINRFYKIYCERKKSIITFEYFLNKLNKKISLDHIDLKTNKLKLKEDVDIRDFLFDLKKLKKKYLNGPHTELIVILSNNIEFGYSTSTLRNYSF